MRKLRFSDDAKNDLKKIAYAIAKDKPDAAKKWKRGIREKCRSLISFPEVGDPRPFLGARVRSTYFGHYIILFEWNDTHIDILQVVRGGPDFHWLQES